MPSTHSKTTIPVEGTSMYAQYLLCFDVLLHYQFAYITAKLDACQLFSSARTSLLQHIYVVVCLVLLAT